MELPSIELLEGVPLPLLRGETHACPYLPGRQATELYALSARVDAATYQTLLDHGFRRSADLFYRPSCPACAACVPIRVPVDAFRPSRSQRRVLARNRDVEVELRAPTADTEHWQLFERYQRARHDGDMLGSRSAMATFLCRSPLPTIEMDYRIGGRLAAAGIVDVTPEATSSVYFYYDPAEARRSLGVFSALCEIDATRRRGLRWWYLGFHIAGCAKMEYKSRFRPYELMNAAGEWRRVEHP